MSKDCIYIAGPECFYKDGNAQLDVMRRRSESFGFDVSLPNDNPLKLDHADLRLNADAIFKNCADSMNRSTAIICDLEFYRGPDVDGGSVYELGMAYARGIRVYGYTRDKRPMVWKYQGSILKNGKIYDQKGRLLPYHDLPFSPNVIGATKIIEGNYDDCLQAMRCDIEEERKRIGIINDACDMLGLSDREQALVTSSGVPVYRSRVSWSVSYLARAGMLSKVTHGVYRISDYGNAAVEKYDNAQLLSDEINKAIAEKNPWKSKKKGDAKQKGDKDPLDEGVLPDSINETSPQEQIDAAFAQLKTDLQDSLLSSIMDKDPGFFEKLVVDLLVKMGYGQGEQTRISNDGGIDGMIATDALGFDPIYVQAKRYSAEKHVGRPELQGFAGALGSISRGVFITTSSFAQSAIDWARHYPHATLVLIDGKRLTELMIQYDLGVSTEKVYRIKRIDGDYFGEE